MFFFFCSNIFVKLIIMFGISDIVLRFVLKGFFNEDDDKDKIMFEIWKCIKCYV